MSKLIRELEQRIVKQVIDDLLAAGLYLAIDHGGEELIQRIKNSEETAMAEMFACDEERLYIYRKETEIENEDGRPDGWVYFIYGNNGYDVINDYTTNLEMYILAAQAIADKYAD